MQARPAPLDSLSTTGRPQEIVLVGASLAHLEFLAQLRAKPLTQARVTLVSPDARMLPDNRLADVLSGDTELAACHIGLQDLAQACGVNWERDKVARLDLPSQRITLAGGRTLRFDWLSLSPRCWDDRKPVDAQMAGALDHGLFTHPMEYFLALWPRVLDLNPRGNLRIAVLGGAEAGAEIAFAIKRRLPQASLTWVVGRGTPAEHAAQEGAVDAALEAALKALDITVLHDHAVAIDHGSVRLACGASLVCDVPVVADRLGPPQWLRDSGLLPVHGAGEAAAEGVNPVDAWSRCSEHPQVFLAAETDNALGHNLVASVHGTALRAASTPHGNAWRGLFQGPGVLLQWEAAPLRSALQRWAKAAHDHKLMSRYHIGRALPQATTDPVAEAADADDARQSHHPR
jgi:NADH dehydrogenase FAD-containing subunit